MTIHAIDSNSKIHSLYETDYNIWEMKLNDLMERVDGLVKESKKLDPEISKNSKQLQEVSDKVNFLEKEKVLIKNEVLENKDQTNENHENLARIDEFQKKTYLQLKEITLEKEQIFSLIGESQENLDDSILKLSNSLQEANDEVDEANKIVISETERVLNILLSLYHKNIEQKDIMKKDSLPIKKNQTDK